MVSLIASFRSLRWFLLYFLAATTMSLGLLAGSGWEAFTFVVSVSFVSALAVMLPFTFSVVQERWNKIRIVVIAVLAVLFILSIVGGTVNPLVIFTIHVSLFAVPALLLNSIYMFFFSRWLNPDVERASRMPTWAAYVAITVIGILDVVFISALASQLYGQYLEESPQVKDCRTLENLERATAVTGGWVRFAPAGLASEECKQHVARKTGDATICKDTAFMASCVIDAAEKSGDAAQCTILPSHLKPYWTDAYTWRGACFETVAFKTGQSRVCYMIQESERVEDATNFTLREQCFVKVAATTGQSHLCSMVRQKEYREACIFHSKSPPF